MPSPRHRSRGGRSRSHSPNRRLTRRSRSRSPQRRPTFRRSRSRSHPSRRKSPRRSRTHSPFRRPFRRSRSRSRNRSFSPRRRRSPSPRGRPTGRRSSPPRRRNLERRSPSPRGPLHGRRSPRRSPIPSSGQQQGYSQETDQTRQSPHSSSDIRRNRSISPHRELSPIARDSSRHEPKERIPSPLHRNGPPNIRHKSDFISGITVITPIRRLLLSDRFQTDDQKQQGEIIIEDNIVIAIQRGPNVKHLSPVQINRDFDPNNVVLIRRPDEGSVPIFDREEIKIFNFDAILDENVYEERRIISVVPSTSQTSSRRKHSPEVTRKIQQQPTIKLDFKPDPRYEPLMKEQKDEDENVRIKRVQKNPNDLRHSLSKRRHEDEDSFDARKKIEAKRRSGEGAKKEGDHVLKRLGDESRERKRERSRERPPSRPSGGRPRGTRERPSGGRPRDSASGRDRQDKGDEKNLPDFKNRPGKFRYDDWKEKPEMIPRNPMYFEHDNREGEGGFRGRGRGFRGRPPPRGRGRGRGFRGAGRGYGRTYTKEKESTWKHDLFHQLTEEEEEKPSSTTKN